MGSRRHRGSIRFNGSPDRIRMSYGSHAPVNWDTDEQPDEIAFDITGSGLQNAYSITVENILSKEVDEMSRTTQVKGVSGWKKRLRDFMKIKHQRVLDFIEVSLPSNPTVSRIEQLLQRFAVKSFYPSAAMYKDIKVDISGEEAAAEIYAELNQKLESVLDVSDSHVNHFLQQTKVLFEMYCETGERLLELEDALNAKLATFDRIKGKLAPLFDITPNEKYDGLMESMEAYMSKVFEETTIEDEYRQLLRAYRRFLALREIITMARARDLLEKEPLCSICLAESVCFAVTPCGHTFCQSCSRRQASHCYICRGSVKEKVKLFFG